MADIGEEITQLQKQAAQHGGKVARARAEAAGAEGRRAGALASLAEEFEVDGIEAAGALETKLVAALRAKAGQVRELLAAAGGGQ